MCCCARQCGQGEKQPPLRCCLLVKWSTFIDRAAKAKTNHVRSSPRLTGEESAELPDTVLLGLCKFLPETAEPLPALVWPSSSVDSYHMLPACRIYPSPLSRTGWELFQNLQSKEVAGKSGREGFYVWTFNHCEKSCLEKVEEKKSYLR